MRTPAAALEPRALMTRLCGNGLLGNEKQNAIVAEFDEAIKYNDAIKANLSKVQDDLNPIRVLELFERISQEDTELLDCYYRPEHLIMQDLPVPPVCIRPSVEMETAAGRCGP